MRELLNLSARLRLQKGSFWLIISVILIINGCIAPSRSNFQATNFYTSFSVWKAMYLTSKREKATPSLKINELCFVHSLFSAWKEKFNWQILNEYPTYTLFTALVFFFMKLRNYLPFSHMSTLLPPKNAYMPPMNDKFSFQANSTLRKSYLNSNNIRFGQ